MSLGPKKLAAIGLVAGGLVLVYWQVLVQLVDAWINDGNYSHGFLIVPIAGYLVWERRKRFAETPIKPSFAGLALFALGIFVLMAGLLGSELFLSRVSLIATLSGVIVFLFGWRHFRIVAFPVAFL